MKDNFNIKIPMRVYKILESKSLKSGTNTRALVRFWMTKALDRASFIKGIGEKQMPWEDELSDYTFCIRVPVTLASLIKETSKNHNVSMSHIFKVCIQENLKN